MNKEKLHKILEELTSAETQFFALDGTLILDTSAVTEGIVSDLKTVIRRMEEI